MTLWFILAVMTAAAAFAVLWPLGRRHPVHRAHAAEADLAVYRDQLRELARDREAGLIGENEAEAARVEIARRLIAAADSAQAESAISHPSRRRRRAAALAALIGLPAGAVGSARAGLPAARPLR